MNEYSIKITGEGTQAEIVNSLEKILSNLKFYETDIDKAQWEDGTLILEAIEL